MATNSTQAKSTKEMTLGELLTQARLEAGYTAKALAHMSGVPASQITKLEHDQVQKPNLGHLAALAGPLNLSVFSLYKAAGYTTPESISVLAPDLEDALRQMPVEVIAKVERYIRDLTPKPATEPVPHPDEFADA